MSRTSRQAVVFGGYVTVTGTYKGIPGVRGFAVSEQLANSSLAFLEAEYCDNRHDQSIFSIQGRRLGLDSRAPLAPHAKNLLQSDTEILSSVLHYTTNTNLSGLAGQITLNHFLTIICMFCCVLFEGRYSIWSMDLSHYLYSLLTYRIARQLIQISIQISIFSVSFYPV